MERGLRRNQPCSHPHLGLPASRAVGTRICCLEVTPPVALCYGSPRKQRGRRTGDERSAGERGRPGAGWKERTEAPSAAGVADRVISTGSKRTIQAFRQWKGVWSKALGDRQGRFLRWVAQGKEHQETASSGWHAQLSRDGGPEAHKAGRGPQTGCSRGVFGMSP